MQRGFFAVGVYRPKRECNVGGIWRSADAFGAALMFTVGHRYRRQASDTSYAAGHIPLIHFDDIDDAMRHLPYGCRLAGVELDPRARPLAGYAHPQRVAYLLGAEDHGLPEAVRARCHDLVQIESVAGWSLNVASAATVVCYSRLTHEQQVRAEGSLAGAVPA